MNVLDKFLDAIRLNDDYDDEDEFFDDEIEDDYEEERPRKRFFSKLNEEETEEEYEQPARKKAAQPKQQPQMRQAAAAKNVSQIKQPQPKPAASAKVTPMRKRQTVGNMEVCVIKPNSMEETKEIADTLLANCTVVLNLEGIDVEVAQRIIDFSMGACYSIDGNIQKVSGYIFILTPANVVITGDIQDILGDAFDIPSIRTEF